MSLPDESSLHKGLGVRRPDIADVRDTPLANLLHIGRGDEPLVVLAKLLWQVDSAIESVTRDRVKREALRYAYNLPQVAELGESDLGDRLDYLEKRHSGVQGFRKNTTNKLPSQFVKRICSYWRSEACKPAPVDEVERIVAAEREYEASGVGDVLPVISSVSLEDRLRDLNSAWPEILEGELLQSPVFFEVSVSGHAVTLRNDECERLLAFTTSERFEGYAGPGREFVQATGREVIERLAEFSDIGLAVNPTAEDRSYFNLTPFDIARIHRQLQTEEA